MQEKINKVIEYLKTKPENQKAIEMIEYLNKDKIKVKVNGIDVMRDFTLDAKWNFITKNIQQGILNKIIKE